MMRNRESASLSRKRRKEHLDTLEKSLDDATRNLQLAKEKIQRLEHENEMLRQENAQLRNGRMIKPVAAGGMTMLMVRCEKIPS